MRSCPDVLAITNLKDRETELAKHAKCMNCLSKAHEVNECPFPACRTCDGVKHNQILCPKAKQYKRSNQTVHHTTSGAKRFRGNNARPQ